MARPGQPITTTLLVPLFRLSAVMSQYAENGVEDLKLHYWYYEGTNARLNRGKADATGKTFYNACVPHFISYIITA
jgi:hypothetical protein